MIDFEERCGADRLIKVEEKDQPKRRFQEAFVMTVDGMSVENDDGQHFVGVGIDPSHLKELIKRCERCAGSPTRGCDINTRTFQSPDRQT